MAKSRIGPFALEAPLSQQSSTGQMFRGIHLEQKKLAAIRIFPIPLGMTPESRQAYAEQLEELKQLRHPGVVRCYGGGFDSRNAFLAYQLVDGESLAAQLERRGRLPWETALDYSRQLAEALQYMHQLEWFHGRLQPDKVIVGIDGFVKITDWRRAEISSMLRSPATRSQMQATAPELLDGAAPDHKSDLYSLGVITYMMLTGQPPYTSRDAQGLANEIRNSPVPSVSSQVLDCPVWLNAIVDQLLAKDPKQRPFSATALLLAFREAERRQSEGVGVLQHATAGFSPLQMNVDRAEAEKVLGIKPKKKRKTREAQEASFWEEPWVLLVAFVAAVSMAVWFMLPLGEETLHSRSEKLLASERWMDWNDARDAYLSQILDRFPDGKYSEWAEEKTNWVNAREAERRMDRDERLGRKDDWSPAQVQYAEARRFERFGDLVTALDKFEAIIGLFDGIEADQPIVFLAAEGVERIKENGLDENSLQTFLSTKMEEAQVAYDTAQIAEAKLKWESIVELYGSNQQVAPIVEEAKQKLAALGK